MTETERSLSGFWRHDRSDDRVRELVSVLQGANNLIGLMGSDLAVTWSGEGSYTDFARHIVALDYGPLRGRACPFNGSRVDEVIGYAAHEGGHCIWSQAGKDSTISIEIANRMNPGHSHPLSPALTRAWRHGERNPLPDGAGGTVNPVLVELCRIQNVLEDAYIDRHVAVKWEVLGEHIRISRHKLAERTPIDLAAIASQRRPDRNAATNIWLSVALYDYALPRRMSKRVRRAMTALLTLTQAAIAEHGGHVRHSMAVDAAEILFTEFPVAEAPMPTLPQAGPGQGQDKGGQSQAAGEGEDDEAGEGAGAGGGGDDDTEEEDAGVGAGGGDDDTEEEDAGAGDEEDDEAGEGAGGGGAGEGDPEGDEGESGEGDGGDQGGDGAGKVGNLDDYDDREVVPVPQELLDAITDAIMHEIEDLSQSVAETLAMDPRQVAATARKADYDAGRAKRVTSQVMPQVQELRRVFDSQKDAQTRYLKGLPKGKLDSRRLARGGAGNLNVFQRRQVIDSPDLAVGLLLDVSGSMSSYMGIVEQAAAVFAEGLIRKPGVNFAAWMYTGGFADVALTRICDRALGKLCLKNIEHGGGTPSGAAIAGVKVLMERMPEQHKLLIHFTDGAPDVEHHVNFAVEAARAAGIRVYAIGAGRMMGLNQQYGQGNWETIATIEDLPATVARLIRGM